MSRSALVLCIALLVYGCDSGSGSAEPSPSPTPTTTPTPTPTAYDSQADTDVRGRDTNANGIRDDLDAYLAANYSGNAQIYMRGLTRSYQSALLSADQSAAVQVADKIRLQTVCIVRNVPNSGEAIARLEAELINTDQRLTAYRSFESFLGASSFALPSKSEREAFCAAALTEAP